MLISAETERATPVKNMYFLMFMFDLDYRLVSAQVFSHSSTERGDVCALTNTGRARLGSQSLSNLKNTNRPTANEATSDVKK